MKNPLLYLALVATSFAPVMAEAQNNTPPGYTFGGMFPGMFGGNNYGVPQGYMNNGQSPFLTMPAPQYPFANPQFPSARQPQASAFPATPMAQPTPFWMQTPQSPARFITQVPSNVAPQNAPPSYTVFTPPGFSSAPPRWAPLPGQAPVSIQSLRPTNNWSIFPNASQNLAPAVPAAPPKWPPQ
ncbi:MAG: hypothetical protein COB08_010635 [Rhodobacteraceae bacterium]|nr:hypothetical protein [Paracoccaceae bacterium]